jgi:hypothetical protein
VVEAGRRGALARTGGRVSPYCQAHAGCPVLTVPPPPLARQAPLGALVWAFWHRTLTVGQISPDNRGSAHRLAALRKARSSSHGTT